MIGKLRCFNRKQLNALKLRAYQVFSENMFKGKVLKQLGVIVGQYKISINYLQSLFSKKVINLFWTFKQHLTPCYFKEKYALRSLNL